MYHSFICEYYIQIPNPLFDLAGITCGHFLVPFWRFFGATMVGKAVIKMHIQVCDFVFDVFCVMSPFSGLVYLACPQMMHRIRTSGGGKFRRQPYDPGLPREAPENGECVFSGLSGGAIAEWSACWTFDPAVGVPVPLATGGHVATMGQLLFAPWAWAYSTLHP